MTCKNQQIFLTRIVLSALVIIQHFVMKNVRSKALAASRDRAEAMIDFPNLVYLCFSSSKSTLTRVLCKTNFFS